MNFDSMIQQIICKEKKLCQLALFISIILK